MSDRGRREDGRGEAGGRRETSKKRIRSKSTKREKLTPFQARLKDSDNYISLERDNIINAKSIKDRLELVSSLLSDDVTDISRVWPNQLKNKDSRIRRELSEKGSDHFKRGENDKVLDFYNRALMYSSGKGIAHTLARRAAFFLSTGEPNLALRDLSTALEYGCLQTELMDFLLSHHTPKISGKYKINTKYKWAENIREYLDAANSIKPKKGGGNQKEEIYTKIMENIMTAAKEQNVDQNLEVKELELPTITEKNPLIPAYSESAAIFYDHDKGRMMKARRDIKAGELICVDSPICSILCPEDAESLSSHCIQCFRFTKAPLPCDNCCTVVFCSKECKNVALQSYHKYECQMKIYELFSHEGREVFGLFMALRAITQKPLQYFTDNRQELEKFMERATPIHPLPGRAYLSSDYRTLVNLSTELEDLEDDVIIRNSVLSVFFCRFLRFSGYFGNLDKPKPMKGKPVMHDTELFILRLIHQLINVQSYNSHSVHEMSETFDWVKIGTSINPSMALVNHSCDSNVIRCNLNKNSILVAGRHIVEGEEITDSYTVHFRTSNLNQRQYHTLKNYNFSCECDACTKNWPLEEDVPDEMPRIPNFDQEIIFKIRTGDKKEIVKEIIDARRVVEKFMTDKNFEEAIGAYQHLCQCLENHIRKPHVFFLQARSGISHCLWNLYCKQKLLDEEDHTEDITGRDHAKSIYKKDFTEKPQDNDALNIGSTEQEKGVAEENKAAHDEERKQMLEMAKQSIANSSLSLSSLKSDNQDMKDSINAIKALAKEHSSMDKVCGNIVLTNEDIAQLLNEKEQEVEILKRELENFNAEAKSMQIVANQRRQQERLEENQKRRKMEEDKKQKREEESQERMRKYKEGERIKKEQKRQKEEKNRQAKEEAFRKKQEEDKNKILENQQKRKLELAAEEDELEKLFAMAEHESEELVASEEINILDTNTMFVEEARNIEDLTCITNQISEPCSQSSGNMIKDEKVTSDKEVNSAQIKNEDLSSNLDKECEKISSLSDTHFQNDQTQQDEDFKIEIGEKSRLEGSDILLDSNTFAKQNIESINILPKVTTEGAGNVWSAIRKVRDNYKEEIDLSLKSESQDTLDIDNIELFIKDLKEKAIKKKEDELKKQIQVARGKKGEQQLESVSEVEETEPIQIETSVKKSEESLGEITPEPFDYEAWNKQTTGYFTSLIEEDTKMHAKDEAYLNGLKKKINEKIKIEIDKKLKATKLNKILPKQKETPTKANNLNGHENGSNKLKDFESLQAKDKERKRKKKEEKFKQAEDKMQDFSLKTQKIDKVAKEAESEIKRMKEMARKIMLKNAINEKEFNEDFENIPMPPTTSKDIPEEKDLDEIHWTEEEINKWPAVEESKGFSNALSMLKNAALGKSDMTNNLKDKISKAKSVAETIPAKVETESEESKISKMKCEDIPKTIQSDISKLAANINIREVVSEVENSSMSARGNAIDRNNKVGSLQSESIKGNEHSKYSIREVVSEVEKSKMSASANAADTKKKVSSSQSESNEGNENSKHSIREVVSEVDKSKMSASANAADTKKAVSPSQSESQKGDDSKFNNSIKEVISGDIRDIKIKGNRNRNVAKKETEGKQSVLSAKFISNPEKQISSIPETKSPTTTTSVKKQETGPHIAVKHSKTMVNREVQEDRAQIPCQANKRTEIQTKTKDKNGIVKISFGKETPSCEIDNTTKQQLNPVKINFRNQNEEASTVHSDIISNNNESKQQNNVKLTSENIDITTKNKMQAENQYSTLIESRPTSEIKKEESSKGKKADGEESKKKVELTISGNSMHKDKISSMKEASPAPNRSCTANISDGVLAPVSKYKLDDSKSKSVPEIETGSNNQIIEETCGKLSTGDKNLLKQELQTESGKETQLKKQPTVNKVVSHHKPGMVHSVNPVSFIPKSNEVDAIKIGSPSALRKMNAERKMGNTENYQISKVPTEIIVFPVKNKSAVESLKRENYSIARVPTETVIIQKVNPVSSVTVKVVAPAINISRPPPPTMKPPPPPKLF